MLVAAGQVVVWAAFGRGRPYLFAVGMVVMADCMAVEAVATVEMVENQEQALKGQFVSYGLVQQDNSQVLV